MAAIHPMIIGIIGVCSVIAIIIFFLSLIFIPKTRTFFNSLLVTSFIFDLLVLLIEGGLGSSPTTRNIILCSPAQIILEYCINGSITFVFLLVLTLIRSLPSKSRLISNFDVTSRSLQLRYHAFGHALSFLTAILTVVTGNINAFTNMETCNQNYAIPRLLYTQLLVWPSMIFSIYFGVMIMRTKQASGRKSTDHRLNSMIASIGLVSGPLALPQSILVLTVILIYGSTNEGKEASSHIRNILFVAHVLRASSSFWYVMIAMINGGIYRRIAARMGFTSASSTNAESNNNNLSGSRKNSLATNTVLEPSDKVEKSGENNTGNKQLILKVHTAEEGMEFEENFQTQSPSDVSKSGDIDEKDFQKSNDMLMA